MTIGEPLRKGRFVLLEALGEGSQGQTFAGIDTREGRPVAIKRFNVRGARSWKEAELAEREAQVLQSLSHPKLPRYIDHFEHEGALYLVMEKIEGESLASLRRRGVVFSEAEVTRLLSDASEVLEYLHGRAPPVIHRDLKPGNVLRRPDGSFAFVDFGSVRDKLRPEGGSTVVGTFGYMAPEQFQGRAFPASDAYGIGATALCMLTGVEPEALPHKGLAVDVRAALRPSSFGALGEVLEQLLEPDPDRRARRIAPLLSQLNERTRPAPSYWPRTPLADPGVRLSYDMGATFERQAREFERRADEFEQRAAAGGPGSRGWRKGAARYRRAAEKMRDAAKRREAAVAQKQARRAARGARVRVRFASPDRGDKPPRGPVRLAIALLFMIGMLAVWMATQAVVPLILQILAIFFARRSLQAAAAAVRRAGQNAVQEIAGLRQWLLGRRDDRPVGAPDDAHGGARVDVPEVDYGSRARFDQDLGEEEREERPRVETGKRRL